MINHSYCGDCEQKPSGAPREGKCARCGREAEDPVRTTMTLENIDNLLAAEDVPMEDHLPNSSENVETRPSIEAGARPNPTEEDMFVYGMLLADDFEPAPFPYITHNIPPHPSRTDFP